MDPDTDNIIRMLDAAEKSRDAEMALDEALGDIIEVHGVRHAIGVMAGKIEHLMEFDNG